MVTPAGSSTTTQSWRQDYTFDRYGNRNFVEANTTTIPKNCSNNSAVCAADRKVFNPSIAASTNRINLDQDADNMNDYAFDAAGNTTRDPQMRKFTYDAENKQTNVESVDANGIVTGTIGEYFYDGDGRRVKKIAWINGQWETTVFVYDASSRLVAEYSTILNPTPQVAYLTNDHLGSPRINTNENGAVISRHDYRPYGEEITERPHSQYATDTIRKQFTGYERDSESDLDYAKARYYKSPHGRFTSNDPLLSSGKPVIPQTWNRYSYTINNPLRFIDPNGLCTAPSGLKPGQVGICFEAFIAQPRVGVGNLGHGDDRGFAGNDPSKTARVTVWVIVSTDEENVYASRTHQVSASLIGGGKTDNWTVAKTGDTDSPPLSLQGTATTDAQLSNIKAKKGEKDFGAGVDVTVSIANGTNGGQQLAKDMQTTGDAMTRTSPTTAGQAAGVVINGAGKVGDALAPAGTIDGNMTIRITGSGQVDYVGGAVRGFPSYALYTYTVGANGSIQTNTVREVSENKIEDLTKPLRPVP